MGLFFMISQNTKHLTIKQIKALIDNNGVVLDIDKARAQNRPVEYCLESLKSALIERQEKAASKYLKSSKALTDEVNAALNATIILPPKMPVNYKSSQLLTGEQFDKQHPIKPKSKILFNFSGPLWQVEKLNLDDRCKIFTA